MAEAIAANEAMANALAEISPWLSRSIRSCRPGLGRCKAWKFCAFCGPIREDVFIRNYHGRLDLVPQLAHMTLTTRPPRFISRKRTLPRLADQFRRLRAKRRFGEFVAGGVVNFQLHWGRAGWLPHAHAVVDYTGKVDEIAKEEAWISRTWFSLTGAWDVRLEPITPGTWPRVLAYGARRPDLSLDPDLLRSFRAATHKFILIRSWGTISKGHGKRPGRRAQAAPAIADRVRADAEFDAELAAMSEPCICGANCGGGCATP